MLKLANCRERQARLLHLMQEQGLDLAVLSNPKTIYYFTGALVDPAQPHAFGIGWSGKSLLVTNQQPEQAAADGVELYTAYTLERIFNRVTIHEELVAAVARRFHGYSGPAAFEFDSAGYALGTVIRSFSPRYPSVDISAQLYQMRRRKDPDEIEAIRATIRITEAAYGAIKENLDPGMTECDAYNLASEAMANAAGTSIAVRGDFACGTRGINGGGPPTGRKLQRGDLYILDLFPAFEGYVCDLCRTFVVGKSSAAQRDAWAHVVAAHETARRVMRPRATGREVYEAVREHLQCYPKFRGSFSHHAGHGVGMDAWEYPWLTPGSEQSLQEGEVVACEPGLYGEELQGGIRLEHDYLVGAEGVTPLDSFPMEL
jgi:Xaa-Pro aminopeptidase